jgi:DSF synthase
MNAPLPGPGASPGAVPAVGIAALLSRPYRHLRLEWGSDLRVLRIRQSVRPIQCYSLGLLGELAQIRDDIAANPGLVRHLVMSSDVPGVFNFGGDLALFVLLVRAGDAESLALYGRQCVDLVWWMETACDRGIHTVALVQGDTLGGGLESVLPCHRIIAERSAQAGFPEVLFNLFPGMGAWDLTVRRSGMAVANELVLSGRLLGAEELHSRRVFDIVVDDGQGNAALDAVLREVDGRHRGTIAALQARRMAAPVSYESLLRIVDHWSQAALSLTDRDLRLMERLARAQARKVGGADEGAVEELKRMELESAWGDRRSGLDRRAVPGADRRGGRREAPPADPAA